MNSRKTAQHVIEVLERNDFRAECPCCAETIRLREAALFYGDDLPEEAKRLVAEMRDAFKARSAEIKNARVEIPLRSESGARATNLGLILEQLAPSMRAFPFEKSDCRPLFDPIDYLVFDGLAAGEVERLMFVELKSGNGRLNQRQEQIRKVVEAGNVSIETYDSPLAKSPDSRAPEQYDDIAQILQARGAILKKVGGT